VVQAPPGAGKTTAVPPALLGEGWARDGKVVILEPRRLAARAAARRMAALHGTPLGDVVGFRMRGEAVVGPRTRLEVVTEGVLTRMLIADPTLHGVAAVLFDEFHERSLVADTGLALALRTAELLRPDLRVVVMSATLDTTAVARLLGGAPVIAAEGRVHAVETRWVPPRAGTRALEALPAVVRRAVDETTGDVLVFLPGAAEIRRAADALTTLLPRDVRLVALHGTLPAHEQDAAIAPSPPGTRKVVLATSIAETSLTIEGVRTVVDSGLARVPRFDPRSGMTRLETVRVTRDGAEQRRGRAGRTAPGVCFRLWDEAEHASLLAHRLPEILSADLAPLALDLALAGAADEDSLHWLDRPPAPAMAQARMLLAELDMLRADGAATPHGVRAAGLGLHPRLAHLVLRGADRGAANTACIIAALLSERDLVRTEGPGPDPDLALRLAAVRGEVLPAGVTVDAQRARRVRDDARRLLDRVRAPTGADDDLAAAELLALAYPDRVALAAGGRGRFRMRTGRGARVSEAAPLARARALAIAETDGARDDARVFLAAALEPAAVERLFADQVTETTATAFDDATGAVTAHTRRMLGALVLGERVARATDAGVVAALFADRVRREGIGAMPWGDAAVRTRQRLAFAHTADAAWPDVSDAALLARLDEWLAPVLGRLGRWDDLSRADLGGALLTLVPPRLRPTLDALAPTHVAVPTGSRIAVDYSDPRAPALAVRMQELFGTADTPRIGGGRVPLTLRLLSPAGRPLQVTRDLASFWRTSYADVRKEMRGRYPRHDWPEDPRAALPTRRGGNRRPARAERRR
jgi:ATP-dependent helicase HrpB